MPRYFSPLGAHDSAQIGKDQHGIPNYLVSNITQVAVCKLPELAVIGNDYPTVDDTGVRDYIHVVNLAQGHLAALKALQTRTGTHVWNLGIGKGYSVLQIIQAFYAASCKSIPYRLVKRRPGDIAACYADPTKAATELGWSANRNLFTMMSDSWRWQMTNPDGYRTDKA